jgi:hypothetical protein
MEEVVRALKRITHHVNSQRTSFFRAEVKKKQQFHFNLASRECQTEYLELRPDMAENELTNQ